MGVELQNRIIGNVCNHLSVRCKKHYSKNASRNGQVIGANLQRRTNDDIRTNPVIVIITAVTKQV